MIKDAIEKYLDDEPKFRERKNKDRGIVNLLMRRYGALRIAVESGAIGKDTVTAIVQDYASMDRAWRKTLEEVPRLRGSDYDEKDRLEAEKMVELGYNAPKYSGPAPATDVEKQKTLL